MGTTKLRFKIWAAAGVLPQLLAQLLQPRPVMAIPFLSQETYLTERDYHDIGPGFRDLAEVQLSAARHQKALEHREANGGVEVEGEVGSIFSSEAQRDRFRRFVDENPSVPNPDKLSFREIFFVVQTGKNETDVIRRAERSWLKDVWNKV